MKDPLEKLRLKMTQNKHKFSLKQINQKQIMKLKKKIILLLIKSLVPLIYRKLKVKSKNL